MTLYKFNNKYSIKPLREQYIKVGGMVITHPTEDILKENGYKPLIETSCNLVYDETQKIAVRYYEESENEILQKWELQDIPEEFI